MLKKLANVTTLSKSKMLESHAKGVQLAKVQH